MPEPPWRIGPTFSHSRRGQAQARGYAVTGFPPPTAGKGGYSVGMFERVEVGDVFLCYCKSPAARWIGALRVTGEVFESDEPVWGLKDDGSARYPWRYAVEPIVALDPERGIPGGDIATELGVLKRLNNGGHSSSDRLIEFPQRMAIDS
jgi:hypothetical protein